MTDAILIRPSRDDDLPAIAAIYGHNVLYGTASFELEPPSLAEMTARRAAVLAKGFPYLVAEADGQVRGYAYASTYRPRPGYDNSVEDSIYIHPNHTGRGIGRPLLDALVVGCEALGLRQVIAIIGDSANHASIRLHTACGFVPAGVLKSIGYKHGRWLDSVMMQRTLGPGDTMPPTLR